MIRRLLLLIPAVLLVAFSGSSPHQVATSVSHKIMSPFCPGVTLHECPSREADELRQKLTRMAARGMNEEELLDWAEGEYGSSIRAVPEKQGRDLAAWIAPGVFLLAGLVALALWLRRDSNGSEPPSSLPGSERSKLEAELERYRRQARAS